MIRFLSNHGLLPGMLLLLATALLPGLQTSAADDSQTVHIATESWDNYTNLDGSGLFLDISRAIFEPQDMRMKVDYVPYKRALHLLESKNADAMFGTYSAKKEGKTYLLTPSKPIDKEQAVAIFDRSKNSSWLGQQSLAGRSLAWVRGYDYQDYLEIKVDGYTEVRDSAQGLKMLQGGRIDYFLDHAGALRDTIKRIEIDSDKYRIEVVIEENVYMAFANTDKGRALASVFDQGISRLMENGELEKIFSRYDIFYPF